jgi:predicted kinase
MKTLYIVRGVPGSGKSTFAKSIGGIHIEADQFFMENGKYNFDITKIKLAHKYCQNQTEAWMKTDGAQVNNHKIVVSNTFTQEWEMKPYFELAEKYGYIVFTVIVENRHGRKNIHDVPEDKIQQMKDRFEFKLV